ncbi:MAG: tRNA guanosine(34) transglycosylase Tgt [Pelagibacteraceae bacterium TMED237]|nr:MAG: tRNA guanosine(34) transglycosylase Tgt [Pelagibacteraceae bacterium TMED237]|tara:strand:- start:5905 stop:7104 length:1200 start_codon:yes stop_codon:yes gene_type:complete
MSKFSWNIKKKLKINNARLGIISTPHGDIETPAFIFCATKAAIKSFTTKEAKQNNTQIILSNTYHLMLQPGSNLIARHGGLHKFIGWDGPMLTDSGGFQIFSLGNGSIADEIKGRKTNSKIRKTLLNINEEGAIFKSYIDGSNIILTPEKSIKIQRDLGADLIVVFDECTPFNVDKNYTSQSMLRSHRWSKRSINAFNSKLEYNLKEGSAGSQEIYGIIQGGIYNDLREESIDFNQNKINTFGIAIGGSLGSSKEEMKEVVNFTASKLNDSRPVHLLGIGDPIDIWSFVEQGIDTFDCVSPTRLARHGSALIRGKKGKINIKNSIYKEKLNPIDSQCLCYTCKNFTLSYLHHLFASQELLALQLLTNHNVYFMNNLMKTIRDSINEDNFEQKKTEWMND